jgi:penicillin-binding protein 2
LSESPPKSIRFRLGAFQTITILVFLILLAQLWRLQVLEGETYQKAADVNRLRLESELAPRGVIYDRRGYLLARNLPEITVAIVPAYLPEDQEARKALLLKLADLLEIPAYDIQPEKPSGLVHEEDALPTAGLLTIVKNASIAPYRAVQIKTGVPRETAMILEEEHLDWPGVTIQTKAVREYIYGPLLAHLLGYVGPIPAARAEEYRALGYDPNTHLVGQTGVEYSFEQDLRGYDGQKLIEVDIAGREVRTTGEPQPAIAGYNVRLTLDLDLQQAMTSILQKRLDVLHRQQGVAIAMNPQTGEILGMVSLPAYDNNKFTGGISVQQLEELHENRFRPLVNHAISGQYPPASTFKMIVASGALEEKTITANTRYHCGGIMWLPNRFYPEDPSLAQPFYCWIYHDYHSSHGSLDVVSALARSCDIFFYQVGGGYRDRIKGLGETKIGYYAELFGFGARTGIDLPGEAPGLVPTAKWKRLNYSESWVTGDTYNMSIGQGFVLATPLQVLNAAAAVGNGGTLYRPQVVYEVIDSDGAIVKAFAPDVIRRLPISSENIELVRRGLRDVISGAGATARGISVPGVVVAGKTGTGEFFEDLNNDGIADRDREGNLPTHAWFVSFAPYDNPEIALVVFIYGGGQGSSAAVPAANEMLNYYFSRNRGEVQP